MKTYRGSRDDTPSSFHVTVQEDDRPAHRLPHRLDLKNHSPLGFWWGQSGSGAAQLALALLADHLGNDVQALKHYVPFMGVLLKLQDAEGNPVASWSLTSADIDAALDELLRSSSPTWPLVGAFANEMERHMRQNPLFTSLELIPAAAIMGAAFDSLQALSRIVVDCDENSPNTERGGLLAPGNALQVQRLTASLAVQALRLAERLGVLKESPKGQRLVSEDKASQRELHLLGELDRIRVLLGANPSEWLEDALYRYTAAVQIGCAKSLDAYAQGIRSGASIAPPSAETGVRVAAAAIRGDVENRLDTAAVQQPDVFRRFLEDRWAEFQQGVVDGIMETWWGGEYLGYAAPPTAKTALRSLLDGYDPLGALRLK